MPTLDWIGRSAVADHHAEVPYRLLHCEGERSAGSAGAGNLVIEGDNLLALKALLPYYKGEVKCIYIDPPYNTGSEGWIYNDNVNSPEIRRWLQQTVGPEAMNGEETESARLLASRTSARYWVRSVERRPADAFCLQTATDRFYPDSVALLEDGRVAAAEYKGAHDWESVDTYEKRLLGELWAARSDGRCVFMLVGTHNYKSRFRAVAG